MLQRLVAIALMRVLAVGAFASAGALMLPDHRQGLALGVLAAVYARIGEGVGGSAWTRRLPTKPRPA